MQTQSMPGIGDGGGNNWQTDDIHVHGSQDPNHLANQVTAEAANSAVPMRVHGGPLGATIGG